MSSTDIATVHEKILSEKRLPFNPKNKVGPTLDLYFHELSKEKKFIQKVLGVVISTFIFIAFIITLPFIAVGIKITSGGKIINKTSVPGWRGIIFTHYRYHTVPAGEKGAAFSAFLKKIGLAKLPSIINYWKSDITLVGPCAYPDDWCNSWNNTLSDFYKRFALQPGFFDVSMPINDPENLELLEKSLDQELRYVVNPSPKKDFKRLLGRKRLLQ